MRKPLAVALLVGWAEAALAVVPATELFIPALGHGTGAVVNGVAAWWRSDVWVFNPSTTQAATVTIFLLLRNQANPSPDSRVITLNPGETRHLPDIVYTTFGRDGTYGGLRITSTVPVVATGSSYDANVTVEAKQRGQGTAGQFFAAIPATDAIGREESTDVVGLDQDGVQTSGTWRSNLAFVETTGNPLDFQLQRIDANGTALGGKSYHLDGQMVFQVNYVVTDVVNTPGSNQRIRVTVTGGSGRLIANASRVDNRTGDPSTVDMTTTAATVAPTVGAFEGTVLEPGGTLVDGALKLVFDGNSLTDYSGLAGIPCGADGYVVDFSIPSGTTVPLTGGTSFTSTVSIPYSGGTSTAFTTSWTLAGTRAGDGTWSGTLQSVTSGGAGAFAGCNNSTALSRNWHAGWTGGS